MATRMPHAYEMTVNKRIRIVTERSANRQTLACAKRNCVPVLAKGGVFVYIFQ